MIPTALGSETVDGSRILLVGHRGSKSVGDT